MNFGLAAAVCFHNPFYSTFGTVKGVELNKLIDNSSRVVNSELAKPKDEVQQN